jgi:N-acetylmuramoyl-L-alanine amidase
VQSTNTSSPYIGRRLSLTVEFISIAGCLALVTSAVVCIVSLQNTIVPAGTIIHHAGLSSIHGRPLDVAELEEIHEQRGFGTFYWGRTYNVGYHYIVLPDGTVQAGRPEHCKGAHAVGYNSFIGICVVGDFSLQSRSGRMGPTAEHMKALVELVSGLRQKYQIPTGLVMPHHAINPNTQCPGERFPFGALVQNQALKR